MADDQRYTEHAQCVFEQPWWMEAVAPGAWEAIEVEDDSDVVARLCFARVRRAGMTVLTMPHLTPYAGPWLELGGLQGAKRRARVDELVAALVDRLPTATAVRLKLHPHLGDWLPFHWAGFEQTTRYTYRLPAGRDEKELWSGLRQNIRRDIKKADKQVTLEPTEDADRFWRLHRLTFDRQGGRPPYAKQVAQRVMAAALAQDQGRCLVAVDAEGRDHAALFSLWDEDTSYYLMGGADPALRSSGAGSRLLWQAVLDASERGTTFDFEGSMLRPIERFFRAFGGELTPYHEVRRLGRVARFGLGVQGLFGGRDG